MKAAALLALVSAVVATPLSLYDNEQSPLGDFLPKSYPGFDLDLTAPRLVLLDGQDEPVVMTELEKIQAKVRGIRFFDVTETPDLGSHAHLRGVKKPSYPAPNSTETVRSVIDTLEIQNLRDGLEKFTSFRTRYYRSQTGKESQQWLLKKITEITKKFAPKSLQDLISIQEFPHSWAQSSVIVRINGSSPSDDGVVVIGAHLDSTNTWPFLPAPGADDDGSGSMSILEAYRALVAAGFHPERAVEFHWYSAEEGGLLGSQAVARAYEGRNVNVVAMSQYDMTAWVKRGTRESVGIITDYVDPDLTEYNKKLVDLYLDIPWAETKCGYACSDHASWGKAGYPSVFTIEATFENSNHGNIHSANDRYDISDEFSFSHMLEFSKLAVSFAVELGGWRKDN
ncbi:peptidase [Pilatotrama ljubarskyi]|nr:peptidase [Pilatotrama ljubarskyi]